jgi:hypothetical protein
MIHRVPLPRGSFLLVGLFAIGAASVLGYSRFTRLDEAPPHTQGPLLSASSPDPIWRAPSLEARPGEVPIASSPVDAPRPPQRDSAELMQRWVAEATGHDAAKRAAAIVALGNTSTSQALPTLERVLSVADDIDRPLALRALRSLAQHQGDADDRIRAAIRKIVYHDADESVSSSAQATLDDIERDLDQAARNPLP